MKIKTYKKPKNIFILSLCVIILSSTVAMYFGNSILWIVSIMTIILTLTDLIYFININKKININQSIENYVYTTDQDIKIKINLDKKVNFHSISFFLQYKSNLNQKRFEYEKISSSESFIIVKSKNIGKVNVGVEYAYIKSPLSIFYKKFSLYKDIDGPFECLILPTFTPIENLELVTLDMSNTIRAVQTHKKEYDDYIGNRPYIPGDSLKYVNWKKTASMQKLLVKEFNAPAVGPSVIIYVDNTKKENFNEVAEAVLAVNDYYIRCKNNLVELKTFNGFSKKYTTSDIHVLSYDLALFEWSKDYNQKMNLLDELNHKICTAIIISEHDTNIDYSLFNKLAQNSLVYLCCDALPLYEQIKSAIDNDVNNVRVIKSTDQQRENK